jgi:hypothetical protein
LGGRLRQRRLRVAAALAQWLEERLVRHDSEPAKRDGRDARWALDERDPFRLRSGKQPFNPLCWLSHRNNSSQRHVGADEREWSQGPSAWIPLSPAGPLPGARALSRGFYDLSTNELVVFGGSTAPSSSPQADLDELWVLSNANGLSGQSAWTKVLAGGTAIPPYRLQKSIYDSARNRMILFGGQTGGFVANQTWVLTNANGIIGNQLRIDGITPARGGNTGTVTMQIVGSGFQSAAKVKLIGLDLRITGANTTAPYASILTTTFDLTGATPGVRNVVVTNPDNTTLL